MDWEKKDIEILSKREEMKKFNRDQILKAARSVFSELGLDGCNVRDIIRASGLSTGTFYNYFQSKEEVFDEVLDTIIQDIHDQAREIWLGALQVQDEDKMALAFHRFFLIFQSQPEYLKFFIKNQPHVRDLRYNGKLSALIKNLEQDIERAVIQGKLPPFPVHLATMILFGSVFEILADMIVSPEKFNIDETSALLASFFKGGILSLSLASSKASVAGIIEQFANLPIHILEGLLKSPSTIQKEKNPKNT